MVGFTSELDQATVAFRRLLAEANSNEQTRVDALVVLAQRTVFAATWPGQGQAVRTLTNREGETAMPLFTGRDLLEDTARRFGWINPDGSLSCRELGAREALRHALGRGVHFVVVDIGSDHAVEFAREEIEPLLQLQNQKSGSGPFAAAGEPQVAILEAVRRSTRPPPAGAVRPSRAPSVPKHAAVDIDIPFANLKAAPVPGASKAPARQSSGPVAQARAASQPMPQAQRGSVRPSGRQARGASQPPRAAAARPAVQPTAAVPEARLPSVRAPALPAPAARGQAPAAAASAKVAQDPASAEASKTAALEVAAALTSVARAAGDPEAQRTAEEMSKLLLQGAGGGDAPPQREDPALSAGKRMAALFLGGDPKAAEEAAAATEAAAEAARQEALHAISNALRAFPEVEWACTFTEPGEAPAIGVRVDPSFLNRVADITDAICDASEKHGQQMQVVLLNNPELIKNARKHGKAFYPWKR